ncbi:hypothetical protein G3R49_19365 [Shewanella sp. WXL01]|uniref:hypothetical protein n=1 Tax=Shewanella sp. WXL01 TaxID=2709721 RepID=UPI0014382AEE|nr:hypothetical protein [Shewanella sp. WXL01]NKF52719.1 hypothetical protein [Shewanella sp. WXL01]
MSILTTLRGNPKRGVTIPRFVLRERDLQFTEKAVFSIIINQIEWHEVNRGYYIPCIEYISKKLGLGYSNVSKIISYLEQEEWLDKGEMIGSYTYGSKTLGVYEALKEQELTQPWRAEQVK